MTQQCRTSYLEQRLGVNNSLKERKLTLCWPDVSTRLFAIKKKATQTLYPHTSINKKLCTLMLIENLAEPEWIQIHCRSKLLKSVYCIAEDHVMPNKIPIQNGNKDGCPVGYILHTEKCLIFLWQNSSEKCHQINTLSANFDLFSKTIYDFSYIIEASSTTNLPILSFNTSKHNLVRFQCNKYLSKYKCMIWYHKKLKDI